MNSIFFIYFIVIICLSFFHKYWWAVIVSIAALLHIYLFSTRYMAPAFAPLSALGGMLIFNVIILLVYWYYISRDRKLENERNNYANWKDKLDQLSSQENALYKTNNGLEKDLNENVSIYEYVKKLGSTLEFDEAVTILQETLRDIITFKKGKLVLIEEGSITKIYNIYRESQKTCDIFSGQPLEFEEKLINELIKMPRQISYERGKPFALPAIKLPQNIKTMAVMPLVTENKLVGVSILENLPLEKLDRVQLLYIQFALEIKKVQLYNKVKKLSIIDGLTQLYLRRHFQELFVNELNRCFRLRQPLSFLMIDIDWFKKYNDEYGHLVGDIVLKTVASILIQKSRENDLLCRYGGDEFVLVLPQTAQAEAQLVAERLRRSVNEHLFYIAKAEFHVAVSIGVASCLPQDMRDSDIASKLTDRADSAMYQAKSGGRNRVVVSN